MCDPISITLAVSLAALTAGQAAASIHASNKQGEAAAKSASNAATADYMATQGAAEQVNAQATAEALKLKRESAIERGRLMAAQSETGFLGNSPLRELYNQRLKEQEALGTNEFNQANALVQNSRDMGSVYATAQGRVNEARAARTNGWTAGLMIAGGAAQGGLQGYTLGKQITKPKKAGVTV
jgi:hypothetical protein